jgi:hypothetical protein
MQSQDLPTGAGGTVAGNDELHQQNCRQGCKHDEGKNGLAQPLPQQNQEQDQTQGDAIKKSCFH